MRARGVPGNALARKRAPTWACVDRNVSLMYGSPRSGGGSSRHAVIAAAVQAAVYVPPTSAIGGAHSRPYCVRGLQRLLQARPRGGCAARCAAVAHATPHTRQQCPCRSALARERRSRECPSRASALLRGACVDGDASPSTGGQEAAAVVRATLWSRWLSILRQRRHASSRIASSGCSHDRKCCPKFASRRTQTRPRYM